MPPIGVIRRNTLSVTAIELREAEGTKILLGMFDTIQEKTQKLGRECCDQLVRFWVDCLGVHPMDQQDDRGTSAYPVRSVYGLAVTDSCWPFCKKILSCYETLLSIDRSDQPPSFRKPGPDRFGRRHSGRDILERPAISVQA